MKAVGTAEVKSYCRRKQTVRRVFGRSDRSGKQTPEKIFGDIICQSPYRKPTQVGEERILRCSSESWLRNSAN